MYLIIFKTWISLLIACVCVCVCSQCHSYQPLYIPTNFLNNNTDNNINDLNIFRK